MDVNSIVDRTYTWKGFGDGFGNWESYCRLRIFFPHPEQQIVVVTDLGHDTGTSITNCAEDLATLIVHDFQLDPTILTWIEHYSGTNVEFSLVRFDWSGCKASHPKWKYLSPHDAESLLGQKL